ncbi:hypothetical protein DRP05_11665 [Archaeoglobales archaeon]|nr:MAG: hypothetical protein DRP05_11665 [Archaeoglobales archaeon]
MPLIEEELKDYRFRAVIKTDEKDFAVKTDARKIALKNNISKRGTLYKLEFEQIQIEIGEDLMAELWELLAYMLPERVVRKTMEEYVSYC